MGPGSLKSGQSGRSGSDCASVSHESGANPGGSRRVMDVMEEIEALIRYYGLEEDGEHVIIPFVDERGNKKRIFLLKRRYMRLMFPDEHHADYPLGEVIEATLMYPERHLTEVIHLFHREHDVGDEGEDHGDKGNGADDAGSGGELGEEQS